MINLAFCDDDFKFLQRVVPLVEEEFIKHRLVVDSSIFTDAKKLLELFKLRRPYFDIIFLDIDMPIMSGKEVAEKLRSIDKNFKLIFMTAYENEALNMFQYDVIGFVPKNRLKNYLLDAVKRAIVLLEDDRNCMQILHVCSPNRNEKYAEMKVALNDIIFIESINRMIYVHTTQDTYLLYQMKFTQVVEKYRAMGFLDIHRTCIVNPKYVASVGETNIRLDNGEILLMSRRKRKEVLNQFARNIYEGVIK